MRYLSSFTIFFVGEVMVGYFYAADTIDVDGSEGFANGIVYSNRKPWDVMDEIEYRVKDAALKKGSTVEVVKVISFNEIKPY